jgi:hypothetical protein
VNCETRHRSPERGRVPGNRMAKRASSVSYGRQFGFWTASASGSYRHRLTTYLVGYTQTSYAGTGSLSRNLKQWTTSIHGSYTHSYVDANLTDNMSANFGASNRLIFTDVFIAFDCG